MKTVFHFGVMLVLACAWYGGSAYGFGFHSSTSFRGGGFGGSGFQSGFHTNDFDRGGMGGGGMGNSDLGSFRQLSSGSFNHNGGFQGDERMPMSWGAASGGANFDHAGVPSFGGYGGGGYGGYGGFHPQNYNFSGLNSGEFGEHYAGQQPSLSAFGGGSAAWNHNNFVSANGGGFDRGGEGFRPGSGEFAGARPTPAELNQFLGMKGGNLSGLPQFKFPAGHAGNAPSWQNMQPAALSQAHNRVQNAVRPAGNAANNASNWLTNHPDRAKEWSDFGDKVRNQWNDHDRPGSDWWSQYHPNEDEAIRNRLDNGPVRPGSDWWSRYHPNLAPWYYHHGWYNHPWWYWWNPATIGSLDAWFTGWGLAAAPIYYDYGPGGNVVYQDGDVYVNGQDVGSDAEYAQTAGDIATVPASEVPSTDTASNSAPAADNNSAADDNSGAQDQWLPLGTFGVLTSEHETDPTRMLQLAVDKQGVISGTLHNTSTNQSYVVQGRVDKKTQRVAMTFGDKSDAVLETGIYNLTQPQTEALVHYGPTKTQKLFLVRLDAPKNQTSSANEPAANTPPQNDESSQ